MYYKSIFVTVLCLLFFTLSYGQNVVTQFADPTDGWGTAPAMSYSTTFDECSPPVTVTFTVTTPNESFNTNGAGYGIGGAENSNTQITVNLTFSSPVSNPILQIADLDAGNESITNVIPNNLSVNQNLTWDGTTINSAIQNGGGNIQWPGVVNFISLTYNRPATQQWGLRFIRLRFSCVESPPECCDDLDAVNPNTDFELGNTGFTSEYNFNSSGTELLPGEYTITSGNAVASICDNWSVADPGCDKLQQFMVVNGRTSQKCCAQETDAVIWAHKIVNIDVDRAYQFCGKFKNLDACCFNVEPVIQITVGSITQTHTIQAGTGPCDWQEITIPALETDVQTGSLSVEITLLQNGAGDGNDLALDDLKIGLIPLNYAQIPESATDIGFQSSPNADLVAEAPTPPSPDCVYAWSACEVPVENSMDCIEGTEVLNPVEWQFLATDFPGYNGTDVLVGTDPGQFPAPKIYKLTYSLACPCLQPRSNSIYTNTFLNLNNEQQGLLQSGTAKVKINPNPTHSMVELNLELDNTKGVNRLILRVFSITGEEMENMPILLEKGKNHITESFDLSNYPSGVYLLQGVMGDELILNEKVIKE